MGINKETKIARSVLALSGTITIDPGRNTGIAIWYGNKYPEIFEISTPKKYTSTSMLPYLQEAFIDIIRGHKIEKAIIEGVDYRENSLLSKMSSSQGYLSVLSYVVGIYHSILSANLVKDIKILIAQEWKGNLTKEATAERVRLINGLTYSSSHVTDAVAIGLSQTELWYLGVK